MHLPEIDEICVGLNGSWMYSTFDMRGGYHHTALSKESQEKFVTLIGKFQLTHVPFGVAQAPAYFQRLVSDGLTDSNFASEYLDSVLIFGPDIKTEY